jgi:hypothetical protein
MNYKSNMYLFSIVCIIVSIILCIIAFIKLYKINIKSIFLNNYDSFDIPQTTKQNFERTQLYGSLFLDNLNEVITNMTNPPILYDTKSIEINKYSDLLL